MIRWIVIAVLAFVLIKGAVNNAFSSVAESIIKDAVASVSK